MTLLVLYHVLYNCTCCTCIILTTRRVLRLYLYNLPVATPCTIVHVSLWPPGECWGCTCMVCLWLHHAQLYMYHYDHVASAEAVPVWSACGCTMHNCTCIIMTTWQVLRLYLYGLPVAVPCTIVHMYHKDHLACAEAVPVWPACRCTMYMYHYDLVACAEAVPVWPACGCTIHIAIVLPLWPPGKCWGCTCMTFIPGYDRCRGVQWPAAPSSIPEILCPAPLETCSDKN